MSMFTPANGLPAAWQGFYEELYGKFAAGRAAGSTGLNPVREAVERFARDAREPLLQRLGNQVGFHIFGKTRPGGSALVCTVWSRWKLSPVHTHGTRAVIVGIKNKERNIKWNREDDGSRRGYARLSRLGTEIIAPGKSIVMMPDEIHSAGSDSFLSPAITLQVYEVDLDETQFGVFLPKLSRVINVDRGRAVS